MKVRILSAEKTKQGFLKEGEQEYLKRFPRELSVTLEECGGRADLLTAIREAKAKRAFVVLLDERGRSYSSIEFAQLLEKRMIAGASSFVFAIGPAEGWEDTDRELADLTLSLSAMTFTYQMTRLILVEQLYRASSIQKGTPYHK
jgi:23S rRNA (pseudouridine1915-N3)-methyltransferase